MPVSKRLISTLLYSAGTVRRNLAGRAGSIAIIMYHRVLPGTEAEGIEPGMYVEPGTFEMHMDFIGRNMDVVPLSEVPRLLPGRASSPAIPPTCAVTFDDGWEDFGRYAFPILKRHGIPSTVFIPTGFIGTGRRFWSDELSILLKAASLENGRGPEALADPLAAEILSLRGPYERRLAQAVKVLKKFREERIVEALARISEALGQTPSRGGRDFLSWEEVRWLRASGIVTFGSHTESHRILTTLEEAEIEEELSTSMRRLVSEGAADPSFIPFCYPDGAYNGMIAGLAKKAGYGMAVTTERGWNGPGTDPYRFKRIGVHQDMTSTEAMLGCRISCII